MPSTPDLSRLPASFVVAIDGPAGSGKSTMARMLAETLGAVMIDTGAMYRAATALALEAGVDPHDEAATARVSEGMSVEFIPGPHGQRVMVNGADWTRRIREADVNAAVSHVAAHPVIRERMTELQRAMGRHGRVVMDGRDIGTHVFPGAAFKFFLVASDRTRAGRRHAELADAGMAADAGAVLNNIRERDRIDSSRAAAPLRRAPDAVEIDTSNMNVDEVLQRMLAFMVSGGACPA